MFETNYTWLQPKTDWKIEYDSEGNYTGDYFEPEDYNRIKNNVNYLKDFAQYLYVCNPVFEDLGEDVYYGSANELTASWWGRLQKNLEEINAKTLTLELGNKSFFSGNMPGRLLEELIRVETICLSMYTIFSVIEKNKPRLAFRLGNMKGIKI